MNKNFGSTSPDLQWSVSDECHLESDKRWTMKKDFSRWTSWTSNDWKLFSAESSSAFFVYPLHNSNDRDTRKCRRYLEERLWMVEWYFVDTKVGVIGKIKNVVVKKYYQPLWATGLLGNRDNFAYDRCDIILILLHVMKWD